MSVEDKGVEIVELTGENEKPAVTEPTNQVSLKEIEDIDDDDESFVMSVEEKGVEVVELTGENEETAVTKPTNQVSLKEIEDIDDDDEDLEETLSERLCGLVEMFPEWMRDGSSSLAFTSISGLSNLLHLSRSLMWIFFSSSCVLIAPVLFEVERGQIEEAQKEQQRRILLGPNAAMSGGQGQSGISMPMPPPPMSQR